MTNEEYNDLFHRAKLNLVAFKMVNHCDDEIKRMVEMAVAAEREACAKVALTGTGEAVHTETLKIIKAERERIADAIRGRT